MLYLSGIHALNVSCELLTCGDWHSSGINWHSFVLLESETSLFGDYGIEQGKTIPNNPGTFNVANHIRALLDLLVQGNYSIAQGMNEDFICSDLYTEEIFQKVSLTKNLSNWPEIDRFMGREYHTEWLRFKEREKL
ncbi:MAG: hypothetical protein KGZ41_00990 [Dethiobacter sp.]|nr:hypothetical protein [Dethiobacter sp.]MBS3898099.1 hypothetical protein [Dethiobacter sp.]MBS3982353.1 hypothetical protein [Dethiobacter sp.]